MNWPLYQTWVTSRVNTQKSKLQTVHDWELLGYMGLAGEAGEVVDLAKKKFFHGKEIPIEKFKEEIGDVFWYLALIMDQLHLTLDEVLDANVNKLVARDGVKGENFYEARK